MWQCPNCDESIEDTFDLCWKCGTARDGTEDAEFENEPVDPTVRDLGEDPPAEIAATEPEVMQASGPMTRREIAALICRTLALLLFAQAAYFSIGGLLMVFVVLAEAPLDAWIDLNAISVALILSVPMLATLIVGVVYWTQADAIGTRMVSADRTPVASVPVTIEDIMMVAFSTAGIFIFVGGVRELIGVLYFAFTFEYMTSELWQERRLWTALIQLAFALWLMIGSRGFIRMIHWLRNAGTAEPADRPEEEIAD